jgi:hypothetical protein
VEGDGFGIVGNVEVNDDSSVKGQLLEVGLEGDVVVAGNDVGREQLAALDVDGTAHLGGGMCFAHIVPSVGAVAGRDGSMAN